MKGSYQKTFRGKAFDNTCSAYAEAACRNTKVTRSIVEALVPRGFMIDHAPGDGGNFFRVVVNLQTKRETIDRLLDNIEEVGRSSGCAETAGDV